MKSTISFRKDQFRDGEGGIVFPPSLVKEETWSSLNYCDLHLSLAGFYLDELKYHKVCKRYNNLLPVQIEGGWLRKFYDYAETIFRFGLSACCGEARHFSEEGMRSFNRTYASVYTRKRCETLEMLCREILTQDILHMDYMPSNRCAVYGKRIDRRNWFLTLAILRDLFNWGYWGRGYGGLRWRAAVEYLMRLHKALMRMNIGSIIIGVDVFVNHSHNNGFLLNKFDCGDCFFRLDGLLDCKSRGHLLFLKHLSKIVCPRKVVEEGDELNGCGYLIWEK